MKKTIYYLLDVSGSIRSGNRLSAMNNSMRIVCNMLRDPPDTNEVELSVSAYAFNDMDSSAVLTPIFEDVDPEVVESAWSDIPEDHVMGGTPLGQALIDLANIHDQNARANELIGDDTAAPAIIILSDGVPTVRDPSIRAQTKEELLEDLEEACSITIDFKRALRAVIALEVDAGSLAEDTLFSLAHGSKTIPTESLCYHAEDDQESLSRALWSATLGSLGQLDAGE